MKYKAVIFDLDGTLIDSMGVWEEVDKEYLQRRNIPVPEDIFAEIAGGNSFREICLHFKDKFALSETIEEIGAEWTEMVAEHYETEVKLKPDVQKLLVSLAEQGVKIALGTSNSKLLAEKVLRANKVRDKFSVIVAGTDGIKGKPFPDIFLQAAAELGVKPQDCLVIEDVLVGVEAAKNAGMDVWAIFDQHASKDFAKIAEMADFYAKDFLQIINKLNLG